MPYNTSAIPPRQEPTGATQLPLSRIKKIIALDQDVHMCSNNAAFVITLATEMFIQYMAEQGHNVVKSERKPRRNVQYRDLASAVSHLDNLEFLVDVVPRTVPYKQVREKKAGAGAGTTDGSISTALKSKAKTIATNGEVTGAAASGSKKKTAARTSVHSLTADDDDDDEDDSTIVAAAATLKNGASNEEVEGGEDQDDMDEDGEADPSSQLRMESRGAAAGGNEDDEDVEMS